MYTSIPFVLALSLATLSSLATATLARLKRDEDDAPFVALLIYETDPGVIPYRSPSGPLDLGVLADFGTGANNTVKIIFDHTFGVDIHTVECRAYKDNAGVVALGKPFNYKTPWEQGGEAVNIGAVLCYTVSEEEAQCF